jgi:hypothetical protein
MNMYEFADIIDKSIIVTRYANQDGRFSARFDCCETKQGACLCGEYADGKTPQEAINNYKNKIVGKTLVFHATSEDYRQEYVAPKMEDV